MERIGGLRKQHAGSGCGVWRAVALRRGSNGAPTPPRGARRLGPAPGPRRLRRPPGLPRPARTPASGGRTTRGSRRPCPGGATYVLCRGHCHCHCCVLLLLPLPQQGLESACPERAELGSGARVRGCGTDSSPNRSVSLSSVLGQPLLYRTRRSIHRKASRRAGDPALAISAWAFLAVPTNRFT